MNATDTSALASCLVDVLNGADAGRLKAACAPGVLVFAPIAEETIDPFAKRDPERIAEFVSAYRSAIPDIRFAVAGVETTPGTVTVRWSASGTHRRALGYIRAHGRPVTLTGVCVFRLAGDRISEIRLATDIYDFLLQTGTLCADPAVARGRAREVNGEAMAALQKAVAGRRSDLGAPMDAGTVVHASVQFYASAAFERKSFEVHGPGQIPGLLAFLREQFTAIELRVDDGVSQGHTTTFRGRAIVEREGERYSYLLRCGFRTAEARVAESWIELQVPPTLHEVFA